MIIRPAESHGEMIDEGNKLRHCVGRAWYAEKMAEGKSAIFFIRKKEEPDRPMVTLELDLATGKKIQCYAVNDTFPGEKVDKFCKRWIQKVVRPQMEKEDKTA